MTLALGTLLLSATDARAESAADNYKLYCVQCHGSAGTGKGINAPFLSVAPRNHTNAKDMGELSDDNVFKAIKEGGVAVGKSTQMPPFGGLLNDAAIKDLVKHLRGMCKCEGKK
ncbi:MAG: cytochrome c [Nitrospinae bacterium]|nr:cytochrome c [Nitrospinota bacterium]